MLRLPDRATRAQIARFLKVAESTVADLQARGVLSASAVEVGGRRFYSGHLVRRQYRSTQLLTPREVCERLGISRTTLYRRMADGRLPEPLRLSERVLRWRVEDIPE
jgi:predicted DNA-binding transcriptional regulator AlpA